ncbi:MAG: cytochrome C oxidase subunit IV family protein [Sporichthyaceae bacterium]
MRLTIVWAALMAATCVSTWLLSKDAFSPSVAVVGMFGLAALKVRYVMLDFMELRHAPIAARVVFEGWIVVVTALILGFWFATPGATH